MLHTGQWKRIFWREQTIFYRLFQRLLPGNAFFPYSVNLSFNKSFILEIDFLANGNHFVSISQKLFPLGAPFSIFWNNIPNKSLLQSVATDFLFSGNDILSFTFFWKPLLQLAGGQYLKNILFLLEETVFFLFFRQRFE